MDDLRPGERFADCRIEAVAGRGGMGVVYRAIELALQRRVALKVVAPENVADEGFAERFGREVRLAASIDHPNVVPVYGAGEEGGRLYLLMRYVDGTDLQGLIGRAGRLEPARAAAIVAQLAAGLDAAHASGLVHRDVKPANVLLTGAEDHVYLTDFGLTVEVSAGSRMTTTGHWIGSVDYMSPEQLRGETVDARTDVYALGGVLHAALTGEAPFRRRTVPQTIAAHLCDQPPRPTARAPVDPAFDGVLARALAKDPADRYRSAGDLGRAAVAAIRGERGTTVERAFARGPAAPSEERTAQLAALASLSQPAATGVAPTRRAEADADVIVPIAPRSPVANGDAQHAKRPAPVKPEVPAPKRRHRARPRAPLVIAAVLVAAATVAVVVGVTGGSPSRAVSASLSINEIRGAAQDFAVAYGEEDPVALGSALADDVRRVAPDGGQQGRATVVGIYRRQFAASDVQSYELDDLQIVRGAAGRAAGSYTVKRSDRDDIEGRVAFGVVREDGRAKIALIATQSE
ncbi:MAG: protein kinase domain-containing protein [Solirubrobacteraceae bacterium]